MTRQAEDPRTAERGLRSESAVVDGRGVSYCEAPANGPGIPLLLVHGIGGSSETWLPLMRCFLQREASPRALAPDMPGYGRSQEAEEALGVPELADWVARYMDALRIPCGDLMGQSMGCQVALALAQRHPRRVRRLVLLGPTTGRRHVPFWRELAGIVLAYVGAPPAYFVRAVGWFSRMGLRRYLATVPKMRNDDPFLRAPHVSAPAVVLRGGRDSVVPEPVARRLAEALPNGRYVEVGGAGHAVHWARTAETAEIVVTFLAPGGG